MKLYETVFVVRQDVTTSQVESLVNDYSQVIKDHNGEVMKTEFCGLRTLAYPIKKNKKGHYVLLNINSDPAGIAEMERLMKLNEDVIRHLTVKVEKHDHNPSALMQQLNFRQEKYRSYDDDDRTPSEGDIEVTDTNSKEEGTFA